MANKKIMLGILALTLVLGLVLAGCTKARPATDFKYELNPMGNGIIIKSFISKTGGSVVIPAKIEGIPVTEIGGNSELGAFEETVSYEKDQFLYGSGNKERTEPITSVIVPDTVTYIGERAFRDCFHLKEVKLPKNLQAFGDMVFMASGITKITIPDSITEISFGAFIGTKITSITIPESVTKIRRSAFGGCHELVEVKLPSHPIEYGDPSPAWSTADLQRGFQSVSVRGKGSFADCPKLSLAVRKAIMDSGYSDEF